MASLLFIHKNAQSSSFGHSIDAREKFLINAHAHSQRRGNQSQIKLSSKAKYLDFQRLDDCRSTNGDVTASASSEKEYRKLRSAASRGFDCQASECTVQKEAHSAEKHNDSCPAITVRSNRLIQEREKGEERLRRERNRDSPIAQSYRPQNHTTDPFNASCIELDEEMYLLLRFYQQTNSQWQYFHTQSLEKQQFKSPDVFGNGDEDVFRVLLSDETSMYAQLSNTAGQVKMTGQMVLKCDASYYVVKALEAFQKKIMASPKVDESMILNAFNLGAADWYLYKLDACLVHTKAVKRLVDLMGGIRALTPLLRGMLGAGDSLLAAEMSAIPTFDANDFEPEKDPRISEWLHEVCHTLNDGRQGRVVEVVCELRRSEHRAILSDKLHEIILELSECTRASLLSRTAQNVPSGIQQWVHHRGLAIRYRLLAMATTDARTDGVRTALLMWTLIVMTLGGRQRTVKLMASRLRRILCSIAIRRWHRHHQVRFWILTVGSMSAEAGSATQAWFNQKILSAVDEWGTPRLKEEDGLVEFSKDFFYAESIQAPMIRHMAERLARTVAAT